MKILIVTPHYYPEQFKITEIAEELAREHEVHVLTNIPNYPEGSFYKGYGYFKKRRQIINNVYIKRIGVIPRKKSKMFLALNYLSFFFISSFLMRITRKKYDLVFSYQISPVTILNGGRIYSKRWKVPHIGYVLDLWPNSLKVINMKETSKIYMILKKVSFKLYRSLDMILISSYSFNKFFKEIETNPVFGIHYLPNYGESILENKVISEEIDLSFNKNITNVVFAGNIGKAQFLESTVIIAKELIKDQIEDVHFHIVGDGSELGKLQNSVIENSMSNLFTFHGRQPFKYMPNYYQQADILYYSLIPDEVISLTLPGKVQGYMAFEKPIFAISQGESVGILKEYGLAKCVNPSDHDRFYPEFIDFIKEVKTGSLKLNTHLYKSTFTLDKVMSKLRKFIDMSKEESIENVQK